MESIITKRARHMSDLGLYLRSLTHSGPLDNLYFVTVQKTGSTWFNKVFNDPILQNIHGLKRFHQRRYEYNEGRFNFPKGTFIPGLYISHDLYLEINKPKRHKTAYFLRDPRDIVVSWYFSMLKTHSLQGSVPRHRAALSSMTVEDGLHYSIDSLCMKFSSMRSWTPHLDNDDVTTVRFEDFKKDPKASIVKILHHCDFDITPTDLQFLSEKYSKANMQAEDLARRPIGSESHYRIKQSKHSDYFTQKHYEHFYNVTGDLCSRLGYID